VAYSDIGVLPGTDYAYEVSALDSAGNVSTLSNTATTRTPDAVVFDGFESGGLTAWPTAVGVVVQSSTVATGSFALRANTTSAGAYARRSFGANYTKLRLRCRFRFDSKGAQSVSVLRAMRTSTQGIVGVYISSTNKLGLRNDITSTNITSTTPLATGVWYQLVLLVDQPAGTVEVRLDGTLVSSLSIATNLGTDPITWMQLSESGSSKSYDLYVDEVLAVDELAPVADLSPPTTPTGLTATADPFAANLSWEPSADWVGVTEYRVIRDNLTIATTTGPAYADTTVVPGATHGYRIRAVDAAANLSPPSQTLDVPVPAAALLDGFETGLGAWSTVSGVTVGSSVTFHGTGAAVVTANNGVSYARRTMPTPTRVAHVRLRLRYDSKESSTVNVVKFMRSSTAGIAGLYLGNQGKLALRNDVAAANVTSNVAVSSATWHLLELRIVVQGASSTAEVWLDGGSVAALTVPCNLGNYDITHLQIGDSVAGRTYVMYIDDLWVT